jgi:hypothetical protein
MRKNFPTGGILVMELPGEISGKPSGAAEAVFTRHIAQ